MIVNYALILITLLLVSGLVVDAGLLEWRQLHLQTAADAAAQEAMLQLARGDSNWSSEGQAQSAFNGFTNGTNGVTVSLVSPPPSGTYAGNAWAVQAVVSQSLPNLFMGLVNAEKSTVAAKAIGLELPTCIWIMNPAGGSNGTFWLASTGITAYCGFYSNTSSGTNLVVDGFGTFSTFRTRAVGASANNASTGYIYPKPIFGAAAKKDPLAYVTAPTITGCNYHNSSLSGSGGYTIGPTTWCGGTTFSNTTVTMTAGTYIFADGLTISNSTIYATAGVTIYLTKYSSASYTNSSISSSTLNMKAPTTASGGGIPGVLIFADRNWVAHGSQSISLSSDTIKSDGIWYTPNIGLTIYNSQITYYKYAVWIIDNLYQYLGHSTFAADYSDFSGGTSPLHYEDGVLAQ